MDEEGVAQHPEAWRPVVWLIGIMLLVEGVGGALLNLFGIWLSYQDYRQPFHDQADYAVIFLSYIGVCFLLTTGLFIAGVGLLRQMRWARRAAVVLLGCQVAIIILAAFTMPVFLLRMLHSDVRLSIIDLEYWQRMLWRLQPFTLITDIVMLLFLSAQAIWQHYGEKSHPGLPTNIAEWCRRRLPAGMQPLFQFLGLLFLCWGAGTWLNHFINFINPYRFWLLAYDYIYRAPTNHLYLLPALVYLAAGFWLVWNWRWSWQAVMIAAGVDIVYLIYSAIPTIMLLPSRLSQGWPHSAIELLEPISIIMQLAIPIIILLLLRKALPLAEGVREPVPER